MYFILNMMDFAHKERRPTGKNVNFVLKYLDFVHKMLDCVLKMLEIVEFCSEHCAHCAHCAKTKGIQIMNFALKVMNCALKMTNFGVTKGAGGAFVKLQVTILYQK